MVQTQIQRILLWDIDGTLIRSTRPGGYKEYTIPVLEELFGTAGPTRRHACFGND